MASRHSGLFRSRVGPTWRSEYGDRFYGRDVAHFIPEASRRKGLDDSSGVAY